MELEPINDISSTTWDGLIENFDTKYIFHQSAWLDFIKETQGGEVVRFDIKDGGKTVGYFAGVIISKGPLRILGSPLPGWNTNYMGPVVNNDFDFEGFLAELDNVCRAMGIHHLELSNPALKPELMRAQGFEVIEGLTYMLNLSYGEERLWRNMNEACRRNVRKATKNGLSVEACSDPVVVDEFYDELIEVFARQKLVPTYPVGRVRSLYKNLHPAWLLPLQVKNNEGDVIASGLFPYDSRCAYHFGSASRKKFQGLYPNELLFWTAMNTFLNMGIPEFNLCGRGSFKPKLGPQEVPVYRFVKSYSVVARWGRKAYKAIFKTRQLINGRIRSLIGLKAA